MWNGDIFVRNFDENGSGKYRKFIPLKSRYDVTKHSICTKNA